MTSDYTYDAIYQLTQVVQGMTTTESYSLDPVGNRTASLGVSSYTTNASNELTATSGASYTYDSNGNTATKVVSSNTTTYAWDYENRLTSVTLPSSGGTVTFKYDPLGRRIYKSVSTGGTSVFAYDGDNLIEETNSSGTVVARYEQTQNIDEPLAMLRSSTTSYYNADGLGSVTSLANGAGALTQTYSFDSFGKTTPTGSVVNPFQYTGRESDPETGLYYYRARYYDQTTGRFIGEDPIENLGGINFYSYASGDPVDFFDPFGLRDYNAAETAALLQQAYAAATAGRLQGLRNIYNNSRGQYDFGWNSHEHDTWTRCGNKYNADQFGNYIAGFEGAAYDNYYFWTTGAFVAEAGVELYGIKYHITGATKAKNDPLDKTGRPDIRAGEKDGWNFNNPGRDCGCTK